MHVCCVKTCCATQVEGRAQLYGVSSLCFLFVGSEDVTWGLQACAASASIYWVTLLAIIRFCLFVCKDWIVQLYLMGMLKVIEPAQLLDKDLTKLSCMMVTVPLLVLIFTCCILGRLLIFVQFGDIGLMEIFLWIIMLSPRVLFLSFPRKVLNIPPLPPLGRYVYLPEGLPYVLETVTHVKKPGLFMRLWVILETSVPVLIQEQDNQNKVNFNRSTRFVGLGELATDQIASLFTLYTGNYVAL